MSGSRADTIAAVSSPPGRSARGLIRASGPDAISAVASLLTEPIPHGVFQPARLRIGPGELPVIASLLPAPGTYTGEPMAEVQVPGNPALLERVLHLLFREGARPAEPGEFTFRAFANGKLDLTQAEGVAATIHAAGDAQLQAASMLRDGALTRFARGLVDDLGQALALVEAGIDFSDQDDVVAITPAQLDARLADIESVLADLRARSRAWSVVEALPRVVLTGLPSVGKSTLFNALLGRRRAVIDPTPGTTRDVLAEPLTLRGGDGRPYEVMLTDLAGDGPAAGTALEDAARNAAREAITHADLVLHLIDHRPAAAPATDAPVITVATKADLGPSQAADVAISAPTGRGIDELRRMILRRLAGRAVSVTGEALALQPRHTEALDQAAAAVADARAGLADQLARPDLSDPEQTAAALRLALDALARLGGELTPDDIIGRVFAAFCVGK